MLQRLFGQAAAPGWLVVELDGKAVRLAHVRCNEAKPVVEFAEKRVCEPSDPKSLERIGREFGVGRFRCLTLLKPADYQLLLVEAPPVAREELKPALRWRIKDMIEYPPDQAALDVLDLPLAPSGGERARQVYTVVARQETVRTTVERFAKAGIKLSVVDVPDTAQRNLARLFEDPQQAVAALTFDPEGALITVSCRGDLYLSRRLDVTSNQLADSAGKYQRASGEDNLLLEDDDARARLFERVLVEVQRSLDACERSYPAFSVARVLVGSVPEEVGLLAHLAGSLYVPVEPLHPGHGIRLPPSSAAWSEPERGRFLRMVGAGLRYE